MCFCKSVSHTITILFMILCLCKDLHIYGYLLCIFLRKYTRNETRLHLPFQDIYHKRARRMIEIVARCLTSLVKLNRPLTMKWLSMVLSLNESRSHVTEQVSKRDSIQVRLNIISLWPSDAIWRHRSGSTLAQVMACCLMAPSHYLNQCWLVISEIHSSISIFRLTHWGRVTHICVNELTIIGSDNGLSPGRCQAIIWTNGGILLIGPLGTKFCEFLIEIYTFSFKKMHFKM